LISDRDSDLGGGFSVHRALPHAKRQMIGPFIFFDQMGPNAGGKVHRFPGAKIHH